MSLVLKNITLRNFLSIGAVTQAVNFDNKEMKKLFSLFQNIESDSVTGGLKKSLNSDVLLVDGL